MVSVLSVTLFTYSEKAVFTERVLTIDDGDHKFVINDRSIKLTEIRQVSVLVLMPKCT